MLSAHAMIRLASRYNLRGEAAEKEIIDRLERLPILRKRELLGVPIQCQIDYHGTPIRLLCLVDPRSRQIVVVTVFPPPKPKKRRILCRSASS
jgi:hypothetical protein